MDEVIMSVETRDPAFEIESQVDIRAPIVMQVLSDERKGLISRIMMVSIAPAPLIRSRAIGRRSGEIFRFFDHVIVNILLITCLLIRN